MADFGYNKGSAGGTTWATPAGEADWFVFTAGQTLDLSSISVVVSSSNTGAVVHLALYNASANYPTSFIAATADSSAAPGAGTLTLAFSSAQRITAGNQYALAVLATTAQVVFQADSDASHVLSYAYYKSSYSSFPDPAPGSMTVYGKTMLIWATGTQIISDSAAASGVGALAATDTYTGFALQDTVAATGQGAVAADDVAVRPSSVVVTGGSSTHANRILWSQPDFSQSTWTKRGTASYSVDGTLGPSGIAATRLTVGSTNNDVYSFASGFAANQDLAITLWVKRISTTGSLYVGNTQGFGSYGYWLVNLAAIGDDWYRVGAQHVPGVCELVVPLKATASGGGGVQIYGGAAGAQVYVCCIQQEAAPASPWIPTTSAVASQLVSGAFDDSFTKYVFQDSVAASGSGALAVEDALVPASAAPMFGGGGTHTNRLRYSAPDLTQSVWTKRGAVTYEVDGVGPGDTPATKVTGLGAAGANDIIQTDTGFQADQLLATSLWVKRISTSGYLYVTNAWGAGSYGYYRVNLAAIGDGWYHVKGAVPGVVEVPIAWKATAAGAAGVQLYSSGTISFHVCRLQQEEAPASPWIPTTGAAASGDAGLLALDDLVPYAGTTFADQIALAASGEVTGWDQLRQGIQVPMVGAGALGAAYLITCGDPAHVVGSGAVAAADSLLPYTRPALTDVATLLGQSATQLADSFESWVGLVDEDAAQMVGSGVLWPLVATLGEAKMYVLSGRFVYVADLLGKQGHITRLPG